MWRLFFLGGLFCLSADAQCGDGSCDTAGLDGHEEANTNFLQRAPRALFGSELAIGNAMRKVRLELLERQGELRSPEPTHSKNAFVTSVCSDEWLPGALGLVSSLKRTNTKADTVLMLTKDVSDKMYKLAQSKFDHVYVKEALTPHPAINRPGADCVTTKFHLWQLPYDKVIFMDADMLAVKSLDHLFAENSEISAQKDPGTDGWNSGMFLLSPSKHTFENIAQNLEDRSMEEVTHQGHFGIPGGDQQFFNALFPDCTKGGGQTKKVGCWSATFPKTQNYFARDLDKTQAETLVSDEDSFTYHSIHFSGDWGMSAKPWMRGCMGKSDSLGKSSEAHVNLVRYWHKVAGQNAESMCEFNDASE